MIRTALSFLVRGLKAVSSTAITPVLEKNVIKTLGLESKTVISMSRIIVLAFAGVLLRDFWRTGIDGWPDAALGIATVLALPVMNTLERAEPADVLEVARMLLARVGAQPSQVKR